VSLTKLIDDRHGPVREFFEERLPDLRSFRARWRAAGPPTILPAGDKPAWGVLGAAIDYRIRYLFDAPDPFTFVAAASQVDFGSSTAAAANAESIMARLEGRDAYGNLAGALKELTSRCSPVGRLLADDDERRLCRLCCLLALHESVARIGLGPTSPLAAVSIEASIDEQLALVDEMWVDDLVALAAGAVDTLGHLFGQPVTPGPVFAGSIDVGGADGDLIVGHTLLEIKTTKNPPERSWLYQLVGYLLLDYDDRYEIDELGFVIPRIPALITWPADELFASLVSSHVDRTGLRAEFRDAISASKFHATS
jgi:hypothetical protein